GGGESGGPEGGVEGVAPRGGDLSLRRRALLRVLGRLGGPLVRHFGGLVASGVSENPPAQPQCLGVRLQGKRSVEREQGAASVTEPERGIPQLVPHEREVRIELDRLLQRGERVAIARELDERCPLECERERGITELGPRGLGKPQGVFGPPLTAQQLEAL